jgi:hypothetical protein
MGRDGEAAEARVGGTCVASGFANSFECLRNGERLERASYRS